MRVLLFGPLRDLAGWREQELSTPLASLSAVRLWLAAESASLGEALARPGVQAAVDKVIVRGEVLLSPGAEVAFLPPMSGG